jgi:hypothetical protein
MVTNKSRETRLRRMLRRRGFTLGKSRTRDSGARTYGLYYILSEDGEDNYSAERSLDGVEQWISNFDAKRFHWQAPE